MAIKLNEMGKQKLVFQGIQSQHQGALGLAQTNALNRLNLENRMHRGFSGGVCKARFVLPRHQEAGGGGCKTDVQAHRRRKMPLEALHADLGTCHIRWGHEGELWH